jgi:hypothetical protein
MYVRIWKPLGVCITLCFPKQTSASIRCATIPPGHLLALWHVANKQERAQAFSALRKKHHFSEYELHEYAKGARVSWIADHIDSTMAQTLASRAYQAVNRVCVGKAKRVRFRSRGRGIDSVEGKRNDVGMRFVLDPNAGDGGFLLWNEQVIPAIIDWRDPVVQHALRHPDPRMCAWSAARPPLRTRREQLVTATATLCSWP